MPTNVALECLAKRSQQRLVPLVLVAGARLVYPCRGCLGLDALMYGSVAQNRNRGTFSAPPSSIKASDW
jgi:hypothetical protein